MGNATDCQLWERAAGGDSAAFGEIFDRHARAVYNHCFRLTASWADAEDLTSTVFLQAWRRRGQIRFVRDTALPWLLAVATNATRNEWRAGRRRLALLHRVGAPPPESDPADDIAERIDDERRMADLLVAVRRLPRGQAEALALCVWAGLSYADTAAALGIQESSVRSRVSRAKAHLAAGIDPATTLREQT